MISWEKRKKYLLFTIKLDLASGRQFEASSTCGLSGPEEYCYSEIDGVLLSDDCYICDASSAQFSRGIENINDEDSLDSLQSGDGMNETDNDNVVDPERTWWQSADGENDVTIELKFERGFDLLRIKVDFRSLRPASGFIETSTDIGTSYNPIQYYSDKCLEDFDLPVDAAVDNNEVGCTSNYTSPSPGPVSHFCTY